MKNNDSSEHYTVGNNLPLCIGEKDALSKYCTDDYPELNCVAEAIEKVQSEYRVRPPLHYGIVEGTDFIYKGFRF